MIYTFPIYITGTAVAVTVLTAVLGVYLLRKRKLLIVALASLLVSAMAGGIFVPTLAMDRVILDDEKLEQPTGIWFAPSTKGTREFRLADTALVTVSMAYVEHAGLTEVGIVTNKNGEQQVIDPGDLWVMNGADIIARLREKGIEVRQDVPR